MEAKEQDQDERRGQEDTRLMMCTGDHIFGKAPQHELRDAVLGNCGTIVSFRIRAEDAPIIAKAIDAPEQPMAACMR